MNPIESILNVIAPYQCLNCGLEGGLLCKDCRIDTCEIVPSRCYRCKKLTTDFAVCASCRSSSNLSNVWVRTLYRGVAKQLVHEMKFNSARQASFIIAELMAEVLPYLPHNVVITHIPTATSRKRQRGYDHANYIAKHLAKHTNPQYKGLLSRAGQTRQVGKGRDERLRQLKEGFFVIQDVRDKSILLVDDIVTTGGTLEAAALELKKSGAKKVYAAVFAQK